MAMSKTLSCELAETMRAKHTRGHQRMHLRELGIAPFNRAVSPKYVHYLLRRILEVEGFTKFRYNNHSSCSNKSKRENNGGDNINNYKSESHINVFTCAAAPTLSG